MTETQNETSTADSGGSAAVPGSALWEAYGPSQIPLTFDHESHVGPTESNDVCGPLCVVGGGTGDESMIRALRIAALLNEHGLEAPNDEAERQRGGK